MVQSCGDEMYGPWKWLLQQWNRGKCCEGDMKMWGRWNVEMEWEPTGGKMAWPSGEWKMVGGDGSRGNGMVEVVPVGDRKSVV